ncbi:hypothetical protein [Rhodospirillum sp. A1_3_36]|uniref:hypothetical protein n=1 Tax=Rhodospirillum sp. A1_3_36 TaxID=3391666 RepID=UPI0039A4C826
MVKMLLETLLKLALVIVLCAGAAFAVLLYTCDAGSPEACAKSPLVEPLVVVVLGAGAVLLLGGIIRALLGLSMPRLPGEGTPDARAIAREEKAVHRGSGVEWYYTHKIVRTILWSPVVMLGVTLWFGYQSLTAVTPLLSPGGILLKLIIGLLS